MFTLLGTEERGLVPVEPAVPFPKELAVWNDLSQSVYTEQEVEVVGIGRQNDANELEKVKDTGRERIKRRKTSLPSTT